MKKKGLPALVQLAILTLITSFVWISFEVFRAYTKTPNVDVPAEVRQPINPTLDQITLDSIVNKVYLSDEEIGDTVLQNIGSGQPEAQPTSAPEEVIVPESTESAQTNL